MKNGKMRASLPAKLTAPRPGNVVSRHRLFRRLDTAMQRPVIWISAPAGSGKTTLVSSYLVGRKLKPLWYQFDLRDADPATFFAYLRQAVIALSPRKRETLPLLTPEYALGLPVFVRNFFEQMFARLPGGTVLVFDNFQDLPESSPLAEMLAQVLSSLPDEANIIFISRTGAPQAFSRARAARQLGEIGPEALLLTRDEARQIGKSFALAELPERQLDELNGRAGRWAAGFILLLEGAESEVRVPDGKVDEHLFDFFAAEIMHCAQPSIQDFLIRSALLPVMDAAATATLTGNHQAEEILRDLVRRNYFISRRTGAVARYEFHPLFRNFLLTELQRQTSPEELRKLQVTAGQLLIQAGDSAAAIRLLTQAGANDEMVGLVLGQAEKLVAEGRYQTLAQWIQAIPVDVREQQPWLEFWFGISLTPFDLLTARKHLEQSYAAFNKAGDVAGIFLSWSGIAETFSLMWDDFGGMEPFLEEYHQLRKLYPQFPSAEVEARVQDALFGVLMYLQPQYEESSAIRNTVEKLLLVAPEADFRVKMSANLSLYYSWAGKFTEMRRVVEASEKIVATEPVSPLSLIMVKLNRSTLCWLTGEPTEAHDAINDAMQIAEQSGVHLLDSFMQSQSVYASGIEGNIPAMGAGLERIQKYLSPHRRLDVAHYHFQMGWYKNLCMDFAAAQQHARQAVSLASRLSAQMPVALCRFGLAKVLAETGEYREAHDLLDLGMTLAQEMPSRHLEFTGKMIRAYFWLLAKDEAECAAQLSQALPLATQDDYFWTFPLWDSKMVSALCTVALQRGIEPDYVQMLIKKWQLLPTGELHKLESWPWPIKITTLGHFALEVDGQAMSDAGRVQGRVIEMLKAIIALGGRDVAEQQISDLLWPDAEGDMARQNFKSTLHRLRKLIGQEAVLLSDGRLSLNPRQVWLDSLAFEQQLAALETADDDELALLATRVLEHYGGGFLPQEHQPWMLGLRERVRSRFLRIIGQAAERLCGLGQWQVAIDCYQKALEIEPLAERFYIGLMRCHHRHGQMAEGLVVYRSCRNALESGLGVSPSPEAEAWYERLRHATG